MFRAILASFVLVVAVDQAVEASGDFDGNGVVEFTDFVLFASKFGASQGDENYQGLFDLNGNGKIEFEDFTLFAAQFGEELHGSKHGITADELEALAKAYRDNGQSKQAIRDYKKLLEISTIPNQRARAMNQLGWLYVASENKETAESYFLNSIATFKDSENRRTRYQVMWSNVGMANIQLAQGNRALAGAYLAMSRKYAPPRP